MLTGIASPANITNDEMNAPYFIGVATTTDSSTRTSHVVSLPTGSKAGDVVSIFSTISTQVVCTYPTGWGTSENTNFSVIIKILDGTEGSSITITTASAVWMNSLASCVRNSVGTFLSGTSGTGSTVADTQTISAASPQMCMMERMIVCSTVSGYPYPNNHFSLAAGNTIAAMFYCTSDPFWYQETYTGPSWTGVTYSTGNWAAYHDRHRTTL